MQRERESTVLQVLTLILQYGGSPVKVGEEEYSLFRDHE